MNNRSIILLLGLLVIVALAFALPRGNKIEHFADDDNPDLTRFAELDQKLTNAGAKRYNYLSDGMNDFIGGFLSETGDNEAQATELLQKSLNSAVMMPTTKDDSGLDIVPITTSGTHAPPSSVRTKIRFCEAVKSADVSTCDVLDDPRYAECGICLLDGKTHDSKTHVGGLYFSDFDKQSANELQKDVDPMARKMAPTVGKCSSRNFVTTKARCKRRMEQIACEAKGGLPSTIPSEKNDCAQCVGQGQTYLYRGPKTETTTAYLHLVVDGDVEVSTPAKFTDVAVKIGLRYVLFTLPNIQEGAVVTIKVSKNASNLIAGQWSNRSGSRTIPFYESVTNKDNFQINGTVAGDLVTSSISSAQLRNFRPGTLTFGNVEGQKPGEMEIVTRLIGYLGEPRFDEEAAACPAGAFAGLEESARMLKSNPCYSDDGINYSQKCVSNLFTAAGGTVMGSGFPVNKKKADELIAQVVKDLKIMGVPELNTVIGYLSAKVKKIMTGVDATGTDIPIDELNKESLFMLGKEMMSPCDINSITGPLTDRCLQYLYDNKGAGKKDGVTYTATGDGGGRFMAGCTRRGTASPLDTSGKIRREALQEARKRGGVRDVQQYFNSIYQTANTGGAGNDPRVLDALNKCYGVRVPTEPNEQTSCTEKLIAEYDISKKPINSSQMQRMLLQNSLTTGPMSDINMIIQRNNGTIATSPSTLKIMNQGANFDTNQSPALEVQARQTRSIEFWIRYFPQQSNDQAYLIDIRGGGVANSWIYGPEDGSFWQGSSVYLDGQKQTWTNNRAIDFKKLQDGKWHHIGLVFGQQINGQVVLGARFTKNNGANYEIGPVKFYSVTLTPQEVIEMYNKRPDWATVPNILGYEHQGCFRDQPSRALPYRLGNFGTKEECAAAAKNANMNAFGLQFHSECWAGNSPEDKFNKYGPEVNCPPMGGTWNQQVYLNPDIKPSLSKNMLVANHSSQCLDVTQYKEGIPIIQWGCHGGDSQRWTYDASDKSIKSATSGLCVAASSGDSWAQIQFQQCSGAYNQRWDMLDDGRVRLEGTNKCVDIKYAANNQGQPAILWDCHGQPNQRFNKRR